MILDIALGILLAVIIVLVIWEIFAALINWATAPSPRELEQRCKELNDHYRFFTKVIKT